VKRREFIGLVGGAVAWPHTASAQQQGKIVTIGVLAIEPWSPIDTFRQALDDLGYIEGKNVRFDYRYVKGNNERLPELANDLVGHIFWTLPEKFFGRPKSKGDAGYAPRYKPENAEEKYGPNRSAYAADEARIAA